MNFNLYNSLIIAGIIQGFIFGIIVLSSKKYRFKSILYLVALILAYSVSNLIYLIADIGLMTYVDMYSYVWLPFASVLTPIFYLYYAYYLNPSKSKILFFEKLLFLPFAIFLTLTLIFRVGMLMGSDALNFANFYLYVIRINEIFSVFYCLIFLLIPLIQTLISQDNRNSYDPKQINPNLDWMYVTFVVLALLTIYWGYLTYQNLFTENQGQVSFYYLWVGVSVSIYWLGYMGIYEYGILIDRRKIRNNSLKTLNFTTRSQEKNKHIAALENLLINEKRYLNPTLTLESVSDALNLSKSHLSRIISNELNTSFTDYLNSFRIEEAKSYLNNPHFSNYTIVAIGLEAGFNSKSSFFEVFKKDTGMTPSAYKRQLEDRFDAEAS